MLNNRSFDRWVDCGIESDERMCGMVQVDLSGGYYDAGDNVKYQFPMAFSITMLSWSVIEYKTELLLADQLQFALDAIRWATDYFLKAVTGPTQIWVQVLGHRSFNHLYLCHTCTMYRFHANCVMTSDRRKERKHQLCQI